MEKTLEVPQTRAFLYETGLRLSSRTHARASIFWRRIGTGSVSGLLSLPTSPRALGPSCPF